MRTNNKIMSFICKDLINKHSNKYLIRKKVYNVKF